MTTEDLNKAWRLYYQGLRLQMMYERKTEVDSPDSNDITLLEQIRFDNQRLYDLIKNHSYE